MSRSLPRILVDQSLGVGMVPQFFRDAGYPVFTIKDEYGRRNVEDEEWLHDAGTRGWVASERSGSAGGCAWPFADPPSRYG